MWGIVTLTYDKIKRIKDWFLTDESDESLSKTRRDFYKFITEHDKRRNTDFVKVFPELEEFLQKCRTA